jgi:MarR family transcriptional regulator, lower aerobic nicotinate degradation pathway regulator
MTKIGSDAPVQPRLPGPPKELLTSALFLLKRLGFAVKERMIEALEDTGLSGYHHAVLALLDEEPRETQATVADALGYDRSHLVGLLDELEDQGLIERRRDPNDRRRQMVSLTPAGAKALARLREIAKRVDEEFFKPLDAAERKQLKALLARLAAHHDARYRTNGGS